MAPACYEGSPCGEEESRMGIDGENHALDQAPSKSFGGITKGGTHGGEKEQMSAEARKNITKSIAKPDDFVPMAPTKPPSQGLTGKRRLTPMELKKQQRVARERRKRVKPLSTHAEETSKQAPGTRGGTAKVNQQVADGTNGNASNEDHAGDKEHSFKSSLSSRLTGNGADSSRADGSSVFRKYLRRSSSSPPGIAIAVGHADTDESEATLSLGTVHLDGAPSSSPSSRPGHVASRREPCDNPDGEGGESHEDVPTIAAEDGLCHAGFSSNATDGLETRGSRSGGSRTGDSRTYLPPDSITQECVIPSERGLVGGGEDQEEDLEAVEGNATSALDGATRLGPGSCAPAAAPSGQRRTGGASLFDMVMSGASSATRDSNPPTAGVGGAGTPKPGLVRERAKNSGSDSGIGSHDAGEPARVRGSVRGFGSSRAQGGKVTSVTSTLSSILQNLRGTECTGEDPTTSEPPAPYHECLAEDTMAPAECKEPPELAEPGERRPSGKNAFSADEWMAMNLEKLSNYRVPETRMGPPEAARESLRRSTTLPARTTRVAGAKAGRTGDDGPSVSSLRSWLPGDRSWELASPFPMGSETPKTSKARSPSAPGEENNVALDQQALPKDEGNDALSSAPADDLPLRTRVRFEMAPGVPVPDSLRGVPGSLDFRALQAFAAGDTGAIDSERGMGSRRRRRRCGDRVGAGVDREGRGRVEGCNGTNGSDDNDHGLAREGSGPAARGTRNERSTNESKDGEGGAVGEDARTGTPLPPPPLAAGHVLEAAASETEEVMEQWRKAMLYWVHPASALPQEALAAQKAARARVLKDPSDATRARGPVHPGGSAETGRDWEQAFSSLYFGLLSRRKTAPAGGSSVSMAVDPVPGGVSGVGGEGFYFQCPRYTVLFKLIPEALGGLSPAGSTECRHRLVPAAAMSQSSRGLRKRLTEAGIGFEMPLDPAGNRRDAKADEEVLEEWKALGQGVNAKAGVTYANEENRSRPQLSLLLFRGHMDVHGLFDFLLEACGSPAGMGGGENGGGMGLTGGGGSAAGRAADVPLLLSREPFLNASLRSLKVRQNGTIHRHKGLGASAAGSDFQVLEVVGHVLPSMVHDLAVAMARACTAAPLQEKTPGSARPVSEALESDRNGRDEGLPQDSEGPEEAKEEAARPLDPHVTDGTNQGAGDGEGAKLFRALFSVDPSTAHLNAGFRPQRRASPQEGNERTGTAGSRPVIRGRYSSETRARVLARKRVVFDVCSVEPATNAFW